MEECDVIITVERGVPSAQAPQLNGPAFAIAMSDGFAACLRGRSPAHVAGLTWGGQ
jgi:hypothetical protein